MIIPSGKLERPFKPSRRCRAFLIIYIFVCIYGGNFDDGVAYDSVGNFVCNDDVCKSYHTFLCAL